MLNTNTCFLYFPLISNTLRTLHTLYLILQWTFLLSDAYCQCVLAQCWEVWTSFYRNGLRRCLTLFWNPDYWLFWLYLHIFISNLTIFPVVVVNLIQHWRRWWIEEKTVWMQKGRRRSWFLWDVSVTHTYTVQVCKDIVLPSRAYFMSWAKSIHMTSALTLPTLSSWGNLEE